MQKYLSIYIKYLGKKLEDQTVTGRECREWQSYVSNHFWPKKWWEILKTYMVMALIYKCYISHAVLGWNSQDWAFKSIPFKMLKFTRCFHSSLLNSLFFILHLNQLTAFTLQPLNSLLPPFKIRYNIVNFLNISPIAQILPKSSETLNTNSDI